ncbi:MAG TPA: LysE family translocator [Dongiaceae bacterium]|nr:LysE family translocator [Dongiaceae bacterium]
MDGLVGFILAGFALAGSPGPATLSLAATGAAFGTRQGLGYLGGLVIGMILVMAIIATGLAGLVLAVPGVAPVVTIAAALYFIYLAGRIATAPPLAAKSDGQHRPGFVAGLLLSLVNPKGYAAMAALFSGFVLIRARLDWDVLLKIAVLTAIIVAVNLVWLGMGALLTRYFRDPRTSRIINLSFAVLLILSVAVAVIL